jgi:hypothetical protein
VLPHSPPSYTQATSSSFTTQTRRERNEETYRRNLSYNAEDLLTHTVMWKAGCALAGSEQRLCEQQCAWRPTCHWRENDLLWDRQLYLARRLLQERLKV